MVSDLSVSVPSRNRLEFEIHHVRYNILSLVAKRLGSSFQILFHEEVLVRKQKQRAILEILSEFIGDCRCCFRFTLQTIRTI